ncbi:hypothetical protein V5O48_018643 [Marasmius crinis-equi]|uniref:Uncharacterized protein n=1 Tax=Marasmius crinis-equi TaxID=585013 RepID=A0ABR3EKN2_9AGAR
MRNVWSRNLHHIARLKATWLNGLGLTTHAKRHTDPPITAEMQVLLSTNRENKISVHIPGRIIEEDLPNDFRGGVNYMRGGKTEKWKRRTTRYRGLTREQAVALQARLEQTGDDGPEDEEADNEDELEEESAFGTTHLVDGRLEFFDANREIEFMTGSADIDNNEWEDTDDELPELKDLFRNLGRDDESSDEE